MKKLKMLTLLGAVGLLSSCDLTQIPGLDKRLSPEDSKAVGAACRHSGRALEDCFTLNPTALQSGVFEGWRDMNDYMVSNKIETVEPQIQNSKFKPDEHEGGTKAAGQDGGHGAAASAPQAGGGPPAGAPPAASAPPRQRWQPGQAGAPSAAAPPAGKPGGGHSAPTDAHASGSNPGSAAAAPKSDAPARPWERKAGSKNTT